MRLSLGLGPVVGPLGAALLLAAAIPLGNGGGRMVGVQTAAAQSAPQQGRKASSKRPVAKAKSKEAGSNTDQVLDTAAKSLSDGNADAAMTALDGILGAGGLSNANMARALYLRGLAHRKKARPAQAIADLTSAVWLKGGLTDADRAAALKERADISREIGVADAGAPAPAEAAGAARQVPEAVTRQPPAAPTGLVTRSPTPGSSGLSEGGFPRVTSETPPRSPPPPRVSSNGDSAQPTSGKSTSSWQSGTSVGTRGGSVADEDRQKSRPAARAPAASPAPGGGVGNFFSGLFGGSPASPPPPARETNSAAAPPWSPSVREPTVLRSAEKASEKKSAAVVTSAVPPAVKGAYRLQIAAVRSRTEAEAVAARVRTEHGRVIGAHKLEVDETVFGNMGTFYRVRLGPFAAVDEPKAVCDQLRTKGYDCLVVTQ